VSSRPSILDSVGFNLKFSISNFQFSIRPSEGSVSREPGSRHILRPISRHLARSAFTLIEIMIVVGIMGVVLTMGVPIVYKAWHKAPMSQAVSDVVEVCSHARALAILQGRQVDVIFHPREGRFEVGSSPVTKSVQPSSPAEQQLPSVPVFSPNSGSPPSSGLSARFSEKVQIEMMDINKLPHEFRDDEVAHVRFFPNGTCDELTLILVSDQNERREITLEITTGLASVESDPRRFK
jgi:prepilin-type N-terminal cleavage/methylation domain-containing protein